MQDDDEQQGGEGERGVSEAHEQAVPAPAAHGGDAADADADAEEECERLRSEGCEQGDARALREAAEEVSSQGIRAERMRGGGGLEDGVVVLEGGRNEEWRQGEGEEEQCGEEEESCL